MGVYWNGGRCTLEWRWVYIGMAATAAAMRWNGGGSNDN